MNFTQYRTEKGIFCARIAKHIQVKLHRKSCFRVHIEHECHFEFNISAFNCTCRHKFYIKKQ